MRWTLAALALGFLAAIGPLPQAGAEEDQMAADKRYVAALARNGELPLFGGWHKKISHGDKRYLSRYGKRSPADDDDAADLDDVMEALIAELSETEALRRAQADAVDQKRSLASLARSGNLPLTEGKRNIASMAKNGLLSPSGPVLDYLGEEKRGGLEGLMRELEDADKRNVASLARNYNLPGGKRNLGSLARSGGFSNLRYVTAKKNQDDDGDQTRLHKRYLASLARSQGLPFPLTKKEDETPGVGEIKRGKRQASDEFPMPVMQTSDLFDYEDLRELMSGGAAPEKRFLGPDKRHIGSLARLGWLPAFRAPSRYARAGLRSGKRTLPRDRSYPADGSQPPEAGWATSPSGPQHLKLDDAFQIFRLDPHY